LSATIVLPPKNAMLEAGLLGLLGVFVACAFASGTDSDLSWQRALGDYVLRHHALPTTLGAATFTAPDARWLPHEWIFATLWALAERTAFDGVFRVGCVLVAFAALLIDAIRARSASRPALMIVLALVVFGMLPSFGLRAQILGWPLLALLLLALESGPRRAFWAIPIAVVWDNLHASGLVVPVIVLVHGFGGMISRRRSVPHIPTLILATGTALASAATPFGFGYSLFAAAWSMNPATDLVTEWEPISGANLLMFVAAFILFGLVVAGEFRGARLSWPQRLLTLALFAAALLHVRNIALFCIVAGPWAAIALTAMLARESPRTKGTLISDCGLIALGAIGGSIIAVAGATLSKPYPDDPTSAVARLVARQRDTRVACEDFSWCSRFAETPLIHVFIDGRIDAYPAQVFMDFRRILSGDSGEVVGRWKINAVIARRGGPLARSLQPPRWQRIVGGTTQLFIRV
jgi:hypothetical protein